jgi:hypothetical protein
MTSVSTERTSRRNSESSPSSALEETGIELEIRTNRPTSTGSCDGNTSIIDNVEPVNPQSLLPVDRGLDAWLFLLGATATEILIWGVPFSIGVLHLYWTTELFPGRGSSTLTLAATLQAGLLYMLVAIVGP